MQDGQEVGWQEQVREWMAYWWLGASLSPSWYPPRGFFIWRSLSDPAAGWPRTFAAAGDRGRRGDGFGQAQLGCRAIAKKGNCFPFWHRGR